MNTPKLRFKDDNGQEFPEWSSAQLGELGETINGLTYSHDNTTDTGLLVLRSSNILRRELNLVDSVFVNIIVPDEKKVRYNDILICVRNGSRALIGKNILIKHNNLNAAHGAFMLVFRSNANEFIYQLFQTSKYYRQVHVNLGATINSINIGDFNKYSFRVPTKKREQQKIASFLSAIDTKITHTNKRIALLEQYKKGVMQQIFSQQLRFKDDNGQKFPEWEEYFLDNLCAITTGKLDVNAMAVNGKYRFYTCAKDFSYIDTYAFDTEALLISGNGYVGYVHYFKGKFNAYQRTYVLDSFTQHIVFIKHYLCLFLRTRIDETKQIGSIPYIVKSVLSEMPISIPSMREQQKIADFLSSLDTKIQLAKSRLAALKSYKQGLLQQMFI
jgi:type I restriction enzyme S subunit